MTEKIAIIGGGIAGLTAGYLLKDHYDVTLFEKDNRLGGNAYTLDTENGEEIDISIFFYSRLEYPNFCRLLSKLGIKSTTFPMEGLSQSFHELSGGQDYYLSCDPKRLSSFFSFRNFKSLMYQAGVLWNYQKGIRLSKKGKFKGLTLSESLELLPGLRGDKLKLAIFPICIMTSMVWNDIMDAPAEFVFNKIEKQCGTPRKFISWRLYPCKTREYVDRMAETFKDNIRLESEVTSISRGDTSVTVKLNKDESLKFDKVIFACPADTALSMLEKPTSDEERLLGPWKYNDGLVVVHKDTSNYPPEKEWGMYGYLYSGDDEDLNMSINAYYRFQKDVPENSAYIGIQHPNIEIDKDLIEFQQVFRTPLYDEESCASIKELPLLNGKLNSYFCGSHFGYGLHEDAITSAIDVGKMLGAQWK